MINFRGDDKQLDRYRELRAQEAESLAQTLSGTYSVPYVDISRMSINTDALRLIPEEQAKKANAAAYSFTAGVVNIVVLSPKNPEVDVIIENLKKKEQEAKIYIGSPASLERAWDRYKEVSSAFASKSGQIDVSQEQMAVFLEQIKETEDISRLIKEVTDESQGSTSAILEVIMAGAKTIKASDVHLEPEEKYTRIRFRIDGVLTELGTIPFKTFRLLNSRIKLISALKLNVRSMRQDGRFSINLTEDSSIDIRTSIIPGAYGEAIVMRLLDPDSINVGLDKLGMNEHLLKILRKEIAKPNGMILTTGPTGSGKTTTLYSVLQEINKPGIKVITIEDPIEYHLEGIVQTQVKASGKANQIVVSTGQNQSDLIEYTFNEGLKSAMRQDPDIIMVGEIRDEETASTAIDASLTGHLVLSTLHTNNAAGAIPRLLDLKINPKVIGPALNMAMAQRLIRKLADKKEMVDPTPEEKEKLEKHLKAIEKRGIEVPKLEKIARPIPGEGKGGSGYHGRVGIFEAVLMDDKVKALITESPGEREVEEAAEGQKILTMAQDGAVKVALGITSLEELERVVAL